ncbi:MAG: ERF family protein [Bacteroidales bacterium]|nr:ERF family protein [Bacteroidales bacterium]
MADENKKLSLMEKINKIRMEMNIDKNNKNDFGKYNYRSVEQIYSKLVPLLQENNLNYSIIKETAQQCGNFLVIHLEARFEDLENGRAMTTEMDVPMTCFEKKGMDSNQVYGSLLSYSRKYIICRDFQIRAGLDELDSDSNQTSEREEFTLKIEMCNTSKEVTKLMNEDFPKLKYNSKNQELRNFAIQKYHELKEKETPQQQTASQVMTKEQFKQKWESDEHGGGIVFDDIADCAKAWGISQNPKTRPISVIRYQVLKAAGVSDAEDYKPEDYE